MTKAMMYAIGVLVTTFSMSAWGQGAYVGVGVGQASVDIECDLDISCTADDSDTAFKIYGGYKFTPNFAIEGGYVDGGEYKVSGSDSFFGTASATFEASGFNIAAVGIIPLSDRFSLHGKAGIFLWDLDVSVTSSTQGSGSLSESGTDPMFGVGGTFNITQRLGIVVEYEKYLSVGEEDVTGEQDVDVLGVGVVLNF